MCLPEDRRVVDCFIGNWFRSPRHQVGSIPLTRIEPAILEPLGGHIQVGLKISVEAWRVLTIVLWVPPLQSSPGIDDGRT